MHGENLIALGKLRPRRLTPAHWRSLLQTNLTQSSDATPYHEIERRDGEQRDVSRDVVDGDGAAARQVCRAACQGDARLSWCLTRLASSFLPKR